MPSPQSGASVFVLATRLFVHYKFKTRKSIDPSAMLVDDAYAREVLAQARAIPDKRLQGIANLFEVARFGGIAPPAPRHDDKAEGLLDLSLDTPG